MRAALGRVVTIAGFTVRETIHGRGLLIAALASLGVIALAGVVGAVFWVNLDQLAGQQGLGEALAREVSARIALSIALGGLSFIAILLTLFLGADTIAGEISRGTILALAARPVARAEIVLGKALGLLLPTVILLTLLGAASTVGTGALSGVWVGDALPALALLALDLAVMLAVAVAISTRLSRTAGTVALLVAYFGITNLAQLFAIGQALDNDWLQQGAVWGRLLLPVGEVSDLAGRLLAGPLTTLAEGLVRGVTAGFEPRPWIVAYAALFLVAAIALGCLGLARRDLR